jgi:hypothetical protein
MKLRPIPFALLFGLASSSAIAGPSWIDWSSASTGSLTVGANTVGVTLSGSTPMGLVNGDYYYNNGATGGTSITGTYGGLTPSDMIQVNGPSSFTLSFNQAILNPYIALVSVGQGYAVNYTFNGPVTVLTAGPNYWGYIGYTSSGNTLTGYEYNGVVQLAGSYTSLTVSTAPGEFWHGFNVGTNAVAAPVPEPETYAMLLAGLGFVSFVARRRKQKLAV